MCEKVKVNASCGCFIGEPKWRRGTDDWYKEPDECNWEGVIELNKDDWEEGFASIQCPECNTELTQDMWHFELID